MFLGESQSNLSDVASKQRVRRVFRDLSSSNHSTHVSQHKEWIADPLVLGGKSLALAWVS